MKNSDQPLQAVNESWQLSHFANTQQNARHVSSAIDGVVTKRIGLTRSTEHHFLMSHQPRKAQGMQTQPASTFTTTAALERLVESR